MFVRHFGSRVVLASEKVKFPHPPTPIFGVLCLTGTGQKNNQDLVTRKWALGAGRSTAPVLQVVSLVCISFGASPSGLLGSHLHSHVSCMGG